jgi:hypothetical protein
VSPYWWGHAAATLACLAILWIGRVAKSRSAQWDARRRLGIQEELHPLLKPLRLPRFKRHRWHNGVVNGMVDLLGDDQHGDGQRSPPGAAAKVYVATNGTGREPRTRKLVSYAEMTDPNRKGLLYVFSALEDGHEIGIGWPDKWHVILNGGTALHLAWFILWTWWARGTWFGLKRRIWYWGLRRRIDRRTLVGKV